MNLIPLPYRIAAIAALVLALFGTGYWQGHRVEHAAWAADTAKRQQAEAAAIINRTIENAKLAAEQESTNTAITRAHDEELAAVRARLAAAERMRKPAFCSESAPAPKAESPGSSDAADPAGGLLPIEVDGNIQALILRTEEVAATARACQAFITKNGMNP